MSGTSKRFLAGLIAVTIAFATTGFAAGCTQKKVTTPDAATPKTRPHRFGLVTGSGGLNDHAFNDMHYNGMMLAKKQLGIEFEYVTPPDDKDFDAPSEALIAKGCDVIIAGAGFYMIDTVERLSQKYPDVLFVLDDAEAKTYRPNVVSISYMQNEGSFLAGALAAKLSAKKSIASLGAADVPVINDFMVGFKAGALHADKSVVVSEEYIQDHLVPGGPETSAWNAPRAANDIATKLFAGDVDIVFQVAGGSGIGVFLAAQKSGKYGIGVDSDQDYLLEGSVLTSMMKNVDKAMVFIIGEIISGTIKNRNYRLGLKEGGIGLSPMAFTKQKIPAPVLEYIGRLEEDIIAGTVKVPTAF